nr:caspase family protein [Armatimonas sp.]
MYSAEFSPDGNRVLAHDKSPAAKLWDTKASKELQVFTGFFSQGVTAAFSPNGKQILTASDDKITRLWDTETGKELCSLIPFDDDTWAVTDPEGRFDGSNSGKVNGLHWVIGLEPVSLDQVKGFHEPGLLARIMERKEPPFQVTDFTKYPALLYPEIQLNEPKAGEKTLQITLTNRGGGIGQVTVKVDGALFIADARPTAFDAKQQKATLTVDMSTLAPLPGEAQRQIEVTARNAFGDVPITSRGVIAAYEPPKSASIEPPRFFALCVGTGNYADPTLNLTYAAKDANDFHDALALGAKKLFGAAKVHTTLLTSDAKDPSKRASHGNITAALEAIRKDAKPADVCLLYFAGHGVSFRESTAANAIESDLYCYPTMEATGLDPITVRSQSFQETRAITSRQLAHWMNAKDGIQATKKALILDTCSAGAAEQALLMAVREITPEDAARGRAIADLRDKTAFHVLMGCARDRASYEASEYGQGLLTYALLEGMTGPALKDDTLVDIPTLFSYAERRVEQLAAGIGGIQRPLVSAPQGVALPVAQFGQEERGQVRLASRKHRVLAPSFLAASGRDTLGLTPRVTAYLRESALASPRGGSFVFLERGLLPSGIQPTGIYKLDGDKVQLDLVLSRGEKELQTLPLTGSKSDPEGLAKKIATALQQRLETLPLDENK